MIPGLRAALALLALAAVAACSTLQVDKPAPVRALDPVNDDIADLVLALDVPEALGAHPQNSTLILSATAPDGTEIEASTALVLADAQEVAATLPQLNYGRGYLLFAIPEQGQQELREAQAAIRAANAEGAATAPDVTLSLDLCAVAPIEPGETTYAVHAALPGTGRLAPLVAGETVAGLLARTGGELKPCDEPE